MIKFKITCGNCDNEVELRQQNESNVISVVDQIHENFCIYDVDVENAEINTMEISCVKCNEHMTLFNFESDNISICIF